MSQEQQNHEDPASIQEKQPHDKESQREIPTERSDGGQAGEPLRENLPEVDAPIPEPSTPEENNPIPEVNTPISQRLCVAHPEVHGTDTFVRSQLKWMAQKLKEAGVSWLRYQLFWHRVEHTRGTFDFSRYDRAVDIMAEAGIRLVGVLAYGNPWATSKTTDDPYFPPDDPADFARYVRATVQHYKGRITRWEVWNEPNAGYRFWKTKPHGDPAGYAKLLVAAAKAVKESDPSSHVAFGGPFYHELVIMGAIPFIKQAFAAQPSLSRLLDHMTVHPYPNYPPAYEPEDGQEDRVPIWKMYSETAKFLPGRPLWITEVGWPSYFRVDREKQAVLLSRSFLLSFASGAELVCWYKFADSTGATLFPAEHLFGLFEPTQDWNKEPPAAKPAYHALQTIHKLLGDATSVKDMRAELSLKQGEFGLRFTAPARSILALWRMDATAKRTIELSLSPATKPAVYNHLGKTLSLSIQGNRLSVPLQTGPTIVVLPSS